jgi:hypothetical protein
MVCCFNCGIENATKKCAKCKSVWFCSKECQVIGWKEHKKDCNDCNEEELVWTKQEETEFYTKINVLQMSYKDKFSVALNSYEKATGKLAQIFNIQYDYIYKNIENPKYPELMDETLLFLKDSDTEFRLLQSHSTKMFNIYKDDTENEWNMTLYAFYDQMYEETTNCRALVCSGITHCYYFLILMFKDDEKMMEYCKKYCLAYYDLVLLYKTKINDSKYKDNIDKALKNTKEIVSLYRSRMKYNSSLPESPYDELK